MVMPRDQNAGRSHIVKADYSSFQRMEKSKYLGTTLTNQNCIQEEIKSRLKSVNVCYHAVQELLSSSLLSKNLKINPYPTAFPYGNGMVLHFYQQQESSTTKTVHKVINKGLKTYV